MLTNAILYKEPIISNKCLINVLASFIMYILCPRSPIGCFSGLKGYTVKLYQNNEKETNEGGAFIGFKERNDDWHEAFGGS